MDGVFGRAGALHDDFLLLVTQIGPGLIGRNPVLFADGQQQHHTGALVIARPGVIAECAIGQRQIGVGHDQFRVDLQPHAESLTIRAGTVRVVEAEGARLNFRQADMAKDTGQLFAVEMILWRVGLGDVVDDNHPFAHFERRFNRVGQACPGGKGVFVFGIIKVMDHQPVDHDFDGVVFVARQVDVLADILHGAIDAHPDKAGLAHIFKDFLVLALAILDQRRQYLNTGTIGQLFDRLDNLLGALSLHQ